ncbi:hypothetical protein LTR70_005850 [Exophiala xenobiotica]|uniref:Uncharacterized protein n=1 Tax=Lithohypha guttulata TaxID=1690604 RepID=A0ABR0K8W7_9EURO|nr:hypothetical protein LTR24_005446 [Lithohypha guttulata]KAK5317350.1 hypothetical protein LTR70_005850 [Exophiala xenobiotica]
MTTDYDYRYSPPVSPRSQPHGYKRKASSHDDELENQSLISSTFKKLRLRVSYRDVTPSNAPSHSAPTSYSHNAPYSHYAGPHEDDYMPVDDTPDRIWVHDLDAEIAEIEAEEAKERDRVQLSEAGNQYAKIPDHLLKQNSKVDDPASNMQMILYRDPISISVPEEDDAVRKTIVEARRRMRDNQPQMEQQGKTMLQDSSSDMSDFSDRLQRPSTMDGDIDMDLD